jgi:hypothetical protein
LKFSSWIGPTFFPYRVGPHNGSPYRTPPHSCSPDRTARRTKPIPLPPLFSAMWHPPPVPPPNCPRRCAPFKIRQSPPALNFPPLRPVSPQIASCSAPPRPLNSCQSRSPEHHQIRAKLKPPSPSSLPLRELYLTVRSTIDGPADPHLHLQDTSELTARH